MNQEMQPKKNTVDLVMLFGNPEENRLVIAARLEVLVRRPRRRFLQLSFQSPKVEAAIQLLPFGKIPMTY